MTFSVSVFLKYLILTSFVHLIMMVLNDQSCRGQGQGNHTLLHMLCLYSGMIDEIDLKVIYTIVVQSYILEYS